MLNIGIEIVGSKSLPLDWQSSDVMQSTKTTFAGLLADVKNRQLSRSSIFLVVVLYVRINLHYGNVRWPVRRSEPKMKIQQWANKRLKSAESLSCGYGIKPEKIESRADKGAVKVPMKRNFFHIFLKYTVWNTQFQGFICLGLKLTIL